MVDTHCHITSEYYDNILEVISKMKDNIIIVSGTNKEDIKEVISLCNYKNIYGTIGIYPTEELDLKIIEDNINNKKIVGIGEIGLDYHLEHNKEEQKNKFIKQLDLARKYNKTVVIHTRDAIQDTYDILKNYKDLKKVIHCYSGSLEMAKEFIKIGCRLGIGGVLTFKNSKLKDVVKEIDLKYLLLETDSPFLAPEPLRGTKNEPYNVIYVAKKIAEIKNISLEEVLDITTLNAKDQFDLE
ncbi:MAG TPA: TatD family hydrolase [Candidatus Faecisoma merdavium]|nr:TatD family hydrolase [Candidatus Faecisoma merdavium]